MDFLKHTLALAVILILVVLSNCDRTIYECHRIENGYACSVTKKVSD